MIRAQGLPEYLCTTCIVREFARVGRSFTASLWGDGLNGLAIEIRFAGQDGLTVAEPSEADKAKAREVCGRLGEGHEPALDGELCAWCERIAAALAEAREQGRREERRDEAMGREP